MSVLGFLRRKGSSTAPLAPRTLATQLLESLTGACQLPEASENDRRAFGRICIGTRAMLRSATSDATLVSVLLRDICAASVGILIDSPVNAGELYWIYIPKPEDPDDVVALSCVIVRCDRGGFERSAYVAAATFIEGEPPALPPPAQAQPAAAPGQVEEEGHRAAPSRLGSKLFLPTPVQATPTPPDFTADPAAVPEAAPAPPPEIPTGDRAEVLAPEAPEPVSCPPPPVCDESISEISAPVESSIDEVEAPGAPEPMSCPPPPVCDESISEVSAPAPVEPSIHEVEAPGAPEPVSDPPPSVCHESISDVSAPAPVESSVDDAAARAQQTREQIRRMADSIRPYLAHLKRMVARLDQQQNGPDDSLQLDMDNALLAMEQMRQHMESLTGSSAQAAVRTPARRSVKWSPRSRQPQPEQTEPAILRRQGFPPSIN
jgi:hypothetical protein